MIAWAVATVLLTVSPFLMRALGDRGLRALERLMGMLLVLLATQMLLERRARVRAVARRLVRYPTCATSSRCVAARGRPTLVTQPIRCKPRMTHQPGSDSPRCKPMRADSGNA